MRTQICRSLLCLLLPGSFLSLPPLVHAADHSTQNSTWSGVQALPIDTSMHINATHQHLLCQLKTVDADSISCTRNRGFGAKVYTFQREQIQSIKLARRTLSTLAGVGIGAGGGAIVGAAITTNPNSWFRGDVIAATTGIGAVAGAAIGYPSDFLAGPTVYRAP